jgi:hypothetical protein
MFLSFDGIHGRQCSTAKWKEQDKICQKKNNNKRHQNYDGLKEVASCHKI